MQIAEQYLKKGSKVYIEGQLQTRKWQDKDGNDRYTTEVVLQGFNGNLTLLDGRRDGGGGEDRGSYESGDNFGRSSPMERTPERRPAAAGGGRSSAPIDDDIPF